MTEPLSPAIDVEELRRLVEKATPGPWHANGPWSRTEHGHKYDPYSKSWEVCGSEGEMIAVADPDTATVTPADAALIAFLGTHASAICTTLAGVGEMRAKLQSAIDARDQYCVDRRTAEAERAGLRSELTKAREKLANATRERDVSAETNAKMSQAIADLDADLAAARERINELDMSTHGYMTAYDRSVKEKHTLESDLARERGRLDWLDRAFEHGWHVTDDRPAHKFVRFFRNGPEAFERTPVASNLREAIDTAIAATTPTEEKGS